MLRAAFPSSLVALLALSTACAAPPAPAAGAELDHHHELHLPPVGPNVRVSLDALDVDVALDSLPHEGSLLPLLSIVARAFPSVDPTSLHLDLFGSDGFHPADRPKCAAPLSSAQLAAARVDFVSHDVSYVNSPALPGCYGVRALSRIVATK